MQPKGRFFQSNPQSWGFKEFNFVSGTYELKDNSLHFNLTVQLQNNHRNFFLFGMPIGIAIIFYFGIAPIIIFGWLAIFGFLLWRVKEDTNFYLELLINELEKDGL